MRVAVAKRLCKRRRLWRRALHSDQGAQTVKGQGLPGTEQAHGAQTGQAGMGQGAQAPAWPTWGLTHADHGRRVTRGLASAAAVGS
jgi:hypothetical protein